MLAYIHRRKAPPAASCWWCRGPRPCVSPPLSAWPPARDRGSANKTPSACRSGCRQRWVAGLLAGLSPGVRARVCGFVCARAGVRFCVCTCGCAHSILCSPANGRVHATGVGGLQPSIQKSLGFIVRSAPVATLCLPQRLWQEVGGPGHDASSISCGVCPPTSPGCSQGRCACTWPLSIVLHVAGSTHTGAS